MKKFSRGGRGARWEGLGGVLAFGQIVVWGLFFMGGLLLWGLVLGGLGNSLPRSRRDRRVCRLFSEMGGYSESGVLFSNRPACG